MQAPAAVLQDWAAETLSSISAWHSMCTRSASQQGPETLRMEHVPSPATATSYALDTHAIPALRPHLYLNSVTWMSVSPSAASTKARKAPGCSGMVTANMASRLAPMSASSETRRRLSKFMLAPLVTATTVLPCRSTKNWCGDELTAATNMKHCTL